MKRTIIFLIMLTLQLSVIFSQRKTDANIFGHVVSDGHIPFATISVKGTTIWTYTNETGHYMLVNLPVGVNVIRAQSAGYKPVEISVSIKAGESKEVNFTLELDVLGLEEIIVSADRSEMKRNESTTIVNTLSPKMFSSAQSVSLGDGLMFSPGIRVENNCQNCGFTQVRMNGLEGPYSQILINSRPVFSSLAGVYGLELIPANMIERVEIIRGGGSALYGSNAIAGIINIILKESLANNYEAGFSSSYTGIGIKDSDGISSDNSINLNASTVSDDGKTGLSIFGFTREREHYDINNDSFSEIAGLSNITAGARLFHRIGIRNRIFIDFFNIKEERAGGNRFSYPIHERDIAEAIKHDIKTGSLTFEKFFREYDLMTFYLSAQRLMRDSYYGANRSLSNYGRSSDLTYNAGIQYKVNLGNSSVIAGLENTGGLLKDKKLGYPDLDNAVIKNDTIIDIPHVDNALISDQSSVSTGLFLQYDLKYSRFKLGAGGRLEYYEVTDNTGNTKKHNGLVFSPRLSIMYEILPYMQARLSYSQGYRAPQIFDEDLHIEASGARRIIHRNHPQLTSEISRSLMASLDFRKLIGTVSLGLLLETFYTRLENPFYNEIGIPDETGTVIYTRRNAEDGAAVKGINMEFNLKPLTAFSLTSGYTLQASRYDVPHEFNSREFFRTPSNYGYMSLDWDFTLTSCLSATATYTGRMLVPYFGPGTDSETGELRRSNPFLDLGIKVSESIKLNGASLQLFAGIKNIFNSYQRDFDTGINRDPAYIYGPLLPRTIYFGMKISNQLDKPKPDTVVNPARTSKQDRKRSAN